MLDFNSMNSMEGPMSYVIPSALAEAKLAEARALQKLREARGDNWLPALAALVKTQAVVYAALAQR